MSAEKSSHGFITDGEHDLLGPNSELTPEEQRHLVEVLRDTEVPAIIALGLAEAKDSEATEAEETKTE